MEESRGFFNSPVIRKNTPLKRLGLSRKRKSCSSESNSSAKISTGEEKFLNSPSHSHSEKFAFDQQIPNNRENSENHDTYSPVNYSEEIELLKIKIREVEEKLETLQGNKNKIEQLESLIELWKNGCKNALLYFSKLLKDGESENINLKSVLNKLGVWETMIQNFQDEPKISSLEKSQ